MRKLLIIILLSSFSIVKAQMPKPPFVDQLEKKLDTTRYDLIRLKTLSSLSDYYQNADPKAAQKYEALGLALALKLKRDSDACMFYGFIGETYIYAGDFKNGLKFCNQEFGLAKKNGYKTIESLASSDIGLAYQMQGDYPQSQDYFFRALTFAEAIKKRALMSICYVNISANFFNQEDYTKTILYSTMASDACKGLKSSTYNVRAKADELIGSSYLKQNKPGAARDGYFNALNLYQDNHDDYGVATMYTLIASTYSSDPAKQLSYGLKAQAMWDKQGPNNLYAINNLGNLGSTYALMARQNKNDLKLKNSLLDKAESYLSKAITIAKATGSKQNVIDFTDTLAVIDASRGNYKEAYENRVFHELLYDSVYSQANKNKIAALEGKHEMALKEKEIQINKLQLANKQKQEWFLIGGLLTLLSFAGLFYFQSTQRKKTNTTLVLLNNELDEANKIKTKFFSILNHDLRGPIANHISFLRLQQKAPDLVSGKASEDYAQKALLSAEKLLLTMEDLLLWSKGQMENFKPSEQIVSVDELFTHMKNSLNHPDNIALSFEQPAGMQLTVDPDYLQTIMFNLTNNAIKALSGTNGGKITWKARENGPKKYLSITDNGPGATADAFRALYDETVPVGIKNGMGLHIVRDLAKAIGCQLKVTSKPGSGVELQLMFT